MSPHILRGILSTEAFPFALYILLIIYKPCLCPKLHKPKLKEGGKKVLCVTRRSAPNVGKPPGVVAEDTWHRYTIESQRISAVSAVNGLVLRQAGTPHPRTNTSRPASQAHLFAPFCDVLCYYCCCNLFSYDVIG